MKEVTCQICVCTEKAISKLQVIKKMEIVDFGFWGEFSHMRYAEYSC